MKMESSMLKRFLPAVLFPFLALLAACPSQSSDSTSGSQTKKTLQMGFVPSENMEEIQRNAQPLIEKMSQKLGMEVQPFITTDYTGLVEAFRGGKLDAAFLTPASYVMAHSEAGVNVILKAKRGTKPYYHSVIFTRTDSGVNSLTDLKGKTFAFGDTLSTAGYIYPLKMLKAAGINPSSDFDNLIFSGGHDATVLAVFNKKVAAGAAYANDEKGDDAAWKRLLKPEEAKQLKVLAVSEPIPADNICISKDLSPELAAKVQAFFVDLGKDPEGQQLIQKLYRIDSFVPATDNDYKGIREAFTAAGIEVKKEMTSSGKGK
jgi:phosphonate transport system substrate-binding protein